MLDVLLGVQDQLILLLECLPEDVWATSPWPAIINLPALFPDLEHINLDSLPRDLVITEAVPEKLLSCNPEALKDFLINSPSIEEARKVVYQLPKLAQLWVTTEGPTLLLPVTLQNLTTIDVECGNHLDWLRGFRGVTFRMSLSAPNPKRLGTFLANLRLLRESTPSQRHCHFSGSLPCAWQLNYHSLLPFTQLQELEVGSS